MPDNPPPPEPRIRLAEYLRSNLLGVTCGVLAVIGGIAVLLWREQATRALRIEDSVPELSPDSESQPSRIPWARRAEEHGFVLEPTGRAEDPGLLSYEDLIQILSSQQYDSIAQAFTQEFLKDPELARLWKEYKRTGDTGAFVRALRSSGAFRQLLAQFGDREEFRRLVERLGNHPKLRSHIAKLREDWEAERERRRALLGAKAKSASLADRPERDEDFKYVTDPALASLGTRLNDLRILRMAYGLNAKQLEALKTELGGVQTGESSWDACERAGVLDQCVEMVKRCMVSPACVQMTGGSPGATTPTTTPTTTPATGPTTTPTTGPTTAPTTSPTTPPPDPCANAECPRDCAFCPAQCGTCPSDCNYNRTCDANETCLSCRDDCCPCGDGVCTMRRNPPENNENCPKDCPGRMVCNYLTRERGCGEDCGQAGRCQPNERCVVSSDPDGICPDQWQCLGYMNCVTTSTIDLEPKIPK